MKYLKYIPWVLILLLTIGVSVYYYRHANAMEKLASAKNEQLMQAKLEIGRAHTKFVTQKEAHELAVKNLDKKLKEEIEKRDALVKLYGDLGLAYKAEKKKGKGVTTVIFEPKEVERVVDLPVGKMFVRLKNGNYKEIKELRVAYKDFRINIDTEAVSKQVNYQLHQKFEGKIVETLLPTGARNHYLEIYEINDKKERVGKVTIDKFEVLRVREMVESMRWWNPKLDLVAGAGSSNHLEFEWLASVGLSISSYGLTADDLRWRFFRIGAGITRHGFALTASPAQLNIGKYLPVISNMWLTPYGGYDFSDKAYIFGLGVGLVF